MTCQLSGCVITAIPVQGWTPLSSWRGVFDAALAGGGAKSINFQELAAGAKPYGCD